MKLSGKLGIILSLVIFSTFTLRADDQKAQVMIIGVFHFNNPGLDTVKIKHMDVMDEHSQAYLKGLIDRIASEYKPTRILLEYNPENEAVMHQRYADYLKGEYELGKNEVYQMGFRLAEAAGNVPIMSVDEREIHWDAEGLFKVMPEVAPEIQKYNDDVFARYSEESQKDHMTLSLRELLIKYNEPETDRINKGFYIMTNSVSKDGNFEGALASSSWWHRNFRMYAKIQMAAKPGERLLVIAGQGHTAILKDLLALDNQIKAVKVNPLF